MQWEVNIYFYVTCAAGAVSTTVDAGFLLLFDKYFPLIIFIIYNTGTVWDTLSDFRVNREAFNWKEIMIWMEIPATLNGDLK